MKEAAARVATPPAPPAITGFERVETPAGPAWIREIRYDPGYRHGGRRIGDLGDICPNALEFLVLDKCSGSAELLFLDTETTGLGGAGTHVFLVGTARLVGAGLLLTQYFLPGPGQEAALLYELRRRWLPSAWLVTYNGKAFDWPLLSDRFVMNAQVPPAIAGHLDLLYWSRRFFGRCLENCSLTSLEQRVLETFRSGDIPGHLIPAAYFEYLRHKDVHALQPVFQHNLHDILSLVALSCEFAAYVTGRQRPPFPGPAELGLARAYEERGLNELAGECYRRALEAGLSSHLEVWALRRLGFLEKRLGEVEQARAAFAAAVDASDHDPVACTELAKYLEHHARDYREAARVVLRALSGPAGRTEPWRTRLRHRLARLERKQERGASASSRP